MKTLALRTFALSLCMSLGLAYGQTITVASVSSDYTLSLPSGYSGPLSTVTITVTYPLNLTPASQYVASTQFTSDFQSFLAAYPSPSDPPEAILGSILQSIMNKYPQIVLGALLGTISGPGQTIAPGITIPGTPIGTITAAMGTYNPSTGVIAYHRDKPITSFAPIAPTKNTQNK